MSLNLVIVGAGPAGLAAAWSASQSKANVTLIDQYDQAGGQIWRGGTHAAPKRYQHLFAQQTELRYLNKTHVIGANADHLFLATPNGPQQLAFDRVILANGARELFLPFPGWTLPKVLGVGGLQALVKGGLPIAGKNVVVAGSGPLLVAVASQLKQRGAIVKAVVEQAPLGQLLRFGRSLAGYPSKIGQAAQSIAMLRNTPFYPNTWVVAAEGAGAVQQVRLSNHHSIECDYLACSWSLIANTELAQQLGCKLEHSFVLVDRGQQTSVNHIYAAGELTGIGGEDKAIVEGQIAGFAATGNYQAASQLAHKQAQARQFSQQLATSFALRPELRQLAQANTLVCRCEDVTFEQLQNQPSWRSAKLQTRCGMGVCQGRVCSSATQYLFGWGQDSVRFPIHPVSVADLVMESV
ncbi:FAD-dependent oxidoreductase [Herpetosiphon giganteus]|uniref:FAD-dependent oxidoreductase n=1 Tax=Herpetosiphon giganteus TaxID=2029754 RepID=UPI001956F0AF|nr:NADPH-dependent 2,4-dienoyl-CoA reductase/sulfur reductase-like enzyme [Herpetosiphon giganteus]